MGQNIRLVENIDGIILSALNNIQLDKGNVLHAIKSSNEGYHGFGEAYFSIIDCSALLTAASLRAPASIIACSSNEDMFFLPGHGCYH